MPIIYTSGSSGSRRPKGTSLPQEPTMRHVSPLDTVTFTGFDMPGLSPPAQLVLEDEGMLATLLQGEHGDQGGGLAGNPGLNLRGREGGTDKTFIQLL